MRMNMCYVYPFGQPLEHVNKQWFIFIDVYFLWENCVAKRTLNNHLYNNYVSITDFKKGPKTDRTASILN